MINIDQILVNKQENDTGMLNTNLQCVITKKNKLSDGKVILQEQSNMLTEYAQSKKKFETNIWDGCMPMFG